jgi:5-methylcytosine-specific restriction endonuclease McrA
MPSMSPPRSTNVGPGIAAEAQASKQGGGATRRLRYKINKVGFADCQICGNTFTSQLIEVDHIQPVALGGSDADEGNVRPLCLQCHSLPPIPRPTSTLVLRYRDQTNT